MKILFATSEAAPFVKTGGLGDVAGSLPGALRQKGVDVRVVLPMYKCIAEQYREQMTYVNHIYIDMAWRKQYCGIFYLEHGGCQFYFIDNLFYFSGDRPYGYIHEDCEKFLFFSKAVMSILPTIDFRPDVIHCNDWQTGAIPIYLDTFQNNPFYQGIKTIMTVHNLQFQGRWNFKGIKDVMGVDDYYFTSDKLEYHKDANLLKGGMVYANKITTVSDTYAWEITTSEYGEGLDGLLRARSGDLVGIVNGISYDDWNSETDDMIFEKYSKDTVTPKKKINKTRLQQQCNIPVDESKFVIGIVSRLTDQKGFDLVAHALEELCNEDIQIIILGTGDEKYENLFRHYAWKYPHKMSSNIYFSNDLSHKIYAACDAFLMPSRFEPCGLSQIISMRYGTVPIVRETGGLKDTVQPYNEFTGEGTGFSFTNYSADDMMYIVRYAMNIYYNNKDAWNHIIKNGMEMDYSWNKSADKYIGLYKDMTGIYDLVEESKKKDDTIEVLEPQMVEKIKKPAPKKATEAKKSDGAKKPAAKSKDIQVENTAKKPVAKKATETKKSDTSKKPTTKNKAEKGDDTVKKPAPKKTTETKNDKKSTSKSKATTEKDKAKNSTTKKSK